MMEKGLCLCLVSPKVDPEARTWGKNLRQELERFWGGEPRKCQSGVRKLESRRCANKGYSNKQVLYCGQLGLNPQGPSGEPCRTQLRGALLGVRSWGVYSPPHLPGRWKVAPGVNSLAVCLVRATCALASKAKPPSRPMEDSVGLHQNWVHTPPEWAGAKCIPAMPGPGPYLI